MLLKSLHDPQSFCVESETIQPRFTSWSTLLVSYRSTSLNLIFFRREKTETSQKAGGGEHVRADSDKGMNCSPARLSKCKWNEWKKSRDRRKRLRTAVGRQWICRCLRCSLFFFFTRRHYTRRAPFYIFTLSRPSFQLAPINQYLNEIKILCYLSTRSFAFAVRTTSISRKSVILVAPYTGSSLIEAAASIFVNRFRDTRLASIFFCYLQGKIS